MARIPAVTVMRPELLALYVLESVARRREDERSAGRYESAAPIPRSQRDPLIMDGASFEGDRKVYV
jgi:hypothetical protein